MEDHIVHMVSTEKLIPLLSPEQIKERVDELGSEITFDYARRIGVSGKPLVVLCVLKGSFIFTADLIRAIQLPLRIEFLGLQSYGDETKSSGVVQITQDLTKSITGDDVIIVEDIVDTGLTSSYLIDLLLARKPSSLKLCSLLHKPTRSIKPVQIDYKGFTVDDLFVVGYGLDFKQTCRNLTGIYVVGQ